MKLAPALAFLALACTKVERTTLPPAPPAEVSGEYAVAWSAGVLGTAVVGLEAVTFAGFPCATTETIGGTYEYDPIDGSFRVEAKSIDGSVKLDVDVLFAGPDAGGEYVALLLAVPCSGGTVTFTRVR